MSSRRGKQQVDKSKAAKLFIDNYYQNLLQRIQEREGRLKKHEELLKDLPKEERERKEKELSKKETEYTRLLRSKIAKKDFKNVKLIGRGAFGEVRLVQKLDDGEYFAMKIINKDFMIEKNHLAHARAERDAMVLHDDPGIVKLFYSFQDDIFLYFVMEFLQGGDFMTLLIAKDVFCEKDAKFYMMEIIEAVQRVHSMNFIHRDLKPDNILIGMDGHIKLSDFGLCTSGHESHLSSFYQAEVPEDYHKRTELVRENSKGKAMATRQKSWQKFRKAMSYSAVGTSNYMAPEILLGKGYGKEVDWWSVGVIMYEMLVGYAPFSCEDPTDTCLLILDFKKSLEFPEEANLSKEAIDLMSQLMCESEKRFGYDEIKAHTWFKGCNWEKVRSSSAPWKPDVSSPTDTKYFDDFEEDPSTVDWSNEASGGSNLYKNMKEKNLPFVGWTFKRYAKDDTKRRTSVKEVFNK